VGRVGAQGVVAVVVPGAGAGRRAPRIGPRAGRLTVAPAELTDRIRDAAGVGLAAVLETSRLPVDIRHQSKIDRAALASRATQVLSGTPVRWASRHVRTS
ncbi:MAG: hypothetical protein ACLGI3_14300, partial [Actinomycetes bacterium]